MKTFINNHNRAILNEKPTNKLERESANVFTGRVSEEDGCTNRMIEERGGGGRGRGGEGGRGGWLAKPTGCYRPAKEEEAKYRLGEGGSGGGG